MTQNPFGQQQGQTHQNMQTGNVSQQMNHGGHEVFDLHETLSETIAALNQAVLLRPHVKDPELLSMLDRQYRFTLDEYNITVEAFKTGRDPSHPTGVYKMMEGNNFVYGLKPSPPKKPIQSASEITDEHYFWLFTRSRKSVCIFENDGRHGNNKSSRPTNTCRFCTELY